MVVEPLVIPAVDGFPLAATSFQPDQGGDTVVTLNAATAVPQHFYRPLAEYLAGCGYIALTYDYRGQGESRPASLRGFAALARDWALLDMAGVVEWIGATYRPRRLFHIGHSYGGQTAGLLPNGDQIDAMATFSSQSGYWRRQGGRQKWLVAFHVYLGMPLLARLFGYLPWSMLGSGEDLPRGVALQWARWCRQPGYLLDDHSLPLDRYADFRAPVLAYSIDDDDWGTPASVDAMMGAYPNLERRHLVPAEYGLEKLGHFGYFRPQGRILWPELVEWFEAVVATSASA